MSENLILPKERIKPLNQNPKRLFIYSAPKVGKTTLVAALDNCLIIDLERGSKYVEAIKVEANSVEDLSRIAKAIEAENKERNGYLYKYIAIDTVTRLEDLVKPLALKMYKETPIGKNFTDNDILTLPQGAGYFWVRKAFKRVYETFEPLCDSLILLGHVKDKSITKDGKDMSAKDIDLSGKIRSITAANNDAIGYLYRDDNKCMISFKTSEDLTCGARPEHLRNKEFIVSEYDETTGEFTFHWNKIFKD